MEINQSQSVKPKIGGAKFRSVGVKKKRKTGVKQGLDVFCSSKFVCARRVRTDRTSLRYRRHSVVGQELLQIRKQHSDLRPISSLNICVQECTTCVQLHSAYCVARCSGT
jgi:hypothetical protein